MGTGPSRPWGRLEGFGLMAIGLAAIVPIGLLFLFTGLSEMPFAPGLAGLELLKGVALSLCGFGLAGVGLWLVLRRRGLSPSRSP